MQQTQLHQLITTDNVSVSKASSWFNHIESIVNSDYFAVNAIGFD